MRVCVWDFVPIGLSWRLPRNGNVSEPKARFKFNGIAGYFGIFYGIFAPSR